MLTQSVLTLVSSRITSIIGKLTSYSNCCIVNVNELIESHKVEVLAVGSTNITAGDSGASADGQYQRVVYADVSETRLIGYLLQVYRQRPQRNASDGSSLPRGRERSPAVA